MARFTLSKNERLRGKTTFEKIFNEGKTLFSHDRVLKAYYITGEAAGTRSVQIAAAVSKKSGNAVWRSRVKRLIREAYRLNKHVYTETIEQNKKSLLVVFSLYGYNSRTHREVTLAMIEPAVCSLLEKISKSVSA